MIFEMKKSSLHPGSGHGTLQRNLPIGSPRTAAAGQ